MSESNLPTVSKKVSEKERNDTFAFWRDHAVALERKGLVSETGLSWLRVLTKRDSIGFENAQIRLGDLGKWDLLEVLKMGCMFDEDEMLLLADLTKGQVAVEERREEIRNAGFNPDSASDVMKFENLKNMTLPELDQEIFRLESQLGLSHI